MKIVQKYVYSPPVQNVKPKKFATRRRP